MHNAKDDMCVWCGTHWTHGLTLQSASIPNMSTPNPNGMHPNCVKINSCTLIIKKNIFFRKCPDRTHVVRNNKICGSKLSSNFVIDRTKHTRTKYMQLMTVFCLHLMNNKWFRWKNIHRFINFETYIMYCKTGEPTEKKNYDSQFVVVT